jgi:hypothetical protein
MKEILKKQRNILQKNTIQHKKTTVQKMLFEQCKENGLICSENNL